MQLSEIVGKIVLVRVCFDLPNLGDTARILDAKETVDLLLENGNQVVLLTHWGRPEKVGSELFTLKLLDSVTEVLEHEVEYINQYNFFDKNLSLRDLFKVSKSRLFLMENTRFDVRENSLDILERSEIAKKYGEIGDYFVDEAFAVSHRQEGTNSDIKRFVPYTFGLSYTKEVEALEHLKKNKNHPFVVVMAGAKLETKLPLIEHMCVVADKVLIAGVLCFTFLKASGSEVEIFDSKIEESFLLKAKQILEKYGDKIVLADDFVFGEQNGKKLGLDIGPKSLAKFERELAGAKTVFWNGPTGYYFEKPYEVGTLELAKTIVNLTDCYSVVGGGDTVACLPSEITKGFDFVSMGGGATLEYLAKK
jgi:phosphoglycerate kinase